MTKMKRIFFLLILLSSLSLFSQTVENNRLDSLMILTTKYSGSQLVDVFIEIAELQGSHNAVQAHQSADEAIRLANQIKYTKGIGKAYLVKGTICNFNNNPITSLQNYKKAKEIFLETNDASELASAYIGIAESYAQQALFDRAGEEYNKAILIFEDLGDYKSLADAFYKSGTNFNMVDDYYKALIAFQNAEKYYELINDIYNFNITKNSIGIVWYHLGNFKEALKAWTEYENAMREIEDWGRVSVALSNKGLIYNQWAEYNEALSTFSEALELAERAGKTSTIAGIYNSMGNAFHFSGNFEKSFEYYHKSVELGEKLDSKQTVSIGLHNIGELHLNLGNADSALFYVEKSLQIEKTLSNRVGIAETMATMGKIYLALKKNSLAFSFFKQAEEVFNEVDNISGLADIYQKYGQAYADIGNDSLTVYYLNKSTEIAEEIDLKKMQFENHLFLSQYFEKEKDYKNALLHQKLYHQLNDSIFNQKTLNRTAYLTIKLEKEAQDKELIEMQHEQEKINYQNKIKSFLSYSVSVILLILAISFYLRFSANKKYGIRLNKQYQKVLESEEKIKALIDASHDIVLLIDRQGLIASANSKAELILHKGNHLNGFDFNEVILPLFKDQFKPHTARVLNLKKSHSFSLVSNAQRSCEITISPVFNDNTEVSGLAIYMQDVTDILIARNEKKKLENQLFQIQKLESVGTMAGGIAHDFNNYLGTILGYSSMGYDDTEEGTALRRYFNQIITASKSAQHTVQKILTFSRKDESRKEIVLNLVNVLVETIEMIESTKPKEVEIVSDFSSKSIEILGDPVEIQQVFINLFNNAFHAMEGVEKALLKCKIGTTIFKDEHVSFLQNFKSNNLACISVSDNGMGMSDQILNRVFEPFFTTKNVGSGTGLGLSVVHGIIKNHYGELFVESILGKGTTFYIYLPAVL